ncbi:MAG: TIGR00730 family Rossman fold protein [bacterium]
MEIHFTRTNGIIDDKVEELIGIIGGIKDPDLIREMILCSLKAGSENPYRADIKLMNSTLKEMRFTSKIFGNYRDKRKVSIFGSARTSPDAPIYKKAKAFGKLLAEKGYMVITGGGGGIMQAANEGAGFENSFGINIKLPFEQKPNPVVANNPRFITYKYFFNRKVAFIKEAHALVLFPGGFGTFDEGMEVLTLAQTGKRDPIPLILIDEDDQSFWGSFNKFLENGLLKNHYINIEDFKLFNITTDIEEAVSIIDNFYRNYHSMRFVEDVLVIRLKHSLSEENLDTLQKEFEKILIPNSKFVLTGAYPDELDEPDLTGFPRLSFRFNYKDFALLKDLINRINSFTIDIK